MYDDKNGRVLRDMLLDEEGNWANVDENGIAYVPYDDERWELLLDNANLDEMVKMYDNAAFQTKAMDSIKKRGLMIQMDQLDLLILWIRQPFMVLVLMPLR